MLGWMLRRREGKGQALTELAIAIPVLALMIFGLIEVGFIIKTRLVLQDAIRSAVRYGAEEGTQTGNGASPVAPLCQADYYALDVIANRLKDSLVDTSRVRAILIYRADQQGYPITSGPTGLPASSHHDQPPVTKATGIDGVQGDYYYATYDPSTGKNQPIAVVNDYGDLWQLFNVSTKAVFNPGPLSGMEDNPPCGATLKVGVPIYGDTDRSSAASIATSLYGNLLDPLLDPLLNRVTYPGHLHGNWPPAFRNNSGTSLGAAPDRYGVEVIYDYEFHTPVFSVIANFLSGSHHLFRVDDHAVFDLSPQ